MMVAMGDMSGGWAGQRAGRKWRDDRCNSLVASCAEEEKMIGEKAAIQGRSEWERLAATGSRSGTLPSLLFVLLLVLL